MNPESVQPPATLIGAFEAKTHLSKLLRETRAGKHFVITQRGEPVAELRPVANAAQTVQGPWGDMEGKIWMADDFCDELEELREFFE